MRSEGCELCGNHLVSVLEIHHLKPLSKGGKSEDGIFSILCPTCHKIVHKCIDSGIIIDEIENYYSGIKNAIGKLKTMVQMGITPTSFFPYNQEIQVIRTCIGDLRRADIEKYQSLKR